MLYEMKRWGIPVLAVAGERSAKGTFGIDVGTEMFLAFMKFAFGMVLSCLWATICFIVFCRRDDSNKNNC
jgi:hypothetical protein